ncbi:MAG TPA: pitrilysin family protein [Saprospiraceae bacterium]|nr:insulinase family protein [Saprospiraceae bacterium]HRO07978.1 pitrilysin family protein [Saprospiraceae bacterium]HRP41473.1 pitrilysin family protein [Saprospiraceae bacterium]
MNRLFLCLLFMGCLHLAQAQLNKIEYQEFTLDNGLGVILHQDKSTPIVAVSVMYHVGSKNENPEKTGFAHFFEHLLFEGSANIGRGEYSKYVENAGGTLNANTTMDRTYYFEILPSNQLELGLWLESERMLQAKVENVGIETQRQVVKEERRMRIDNQPYGSLLEEIMKRAYTVHPYRWPVIGSMAHLDAAQESDYVNFYKDFYVPNNAIVSIAGDIDYEQAKSLVIKYFGSIPKSSKPVYRPHIQEPPLKGEIRDTVYDNIQLPAVIMAYRIPAAGTPDYYAVSMLGTLLSQGESSRLHKAIVDEQQKAMFVGNFPLNTEDPGVSIAFGICSLGSDVKDVEESITKEIDKIKTTIISDAEFQKLRNQVENDFITANSRVAGVAESLANYKMYYGDANLINTELDRYLAVTKEDIMNAAKKYYTTNNRVVLHYLPKTANP